MESGLARKHTTRSRAIVEALALELEQINGSTFSEHAVQV